MFTNRDLTDSEKVGLQMITRLLGCTAETDIDEFSLQEVLTCLKQISPTISEKKELGNITRLLEQGRAYSFPSVQMYNSIDEAFRSPHSPEEPRGDQVSDGAGIGYCMSPSFLQPGDTYTPNDGHLKGIEHVVVANTAKCITKPCGECGHTTKFYYDCLFIALIVDKVEEIAQTLRD